MPSEREQWPDDQEFRRFASTIADAVMVWMHRGGVIYDYELDGKRCNCPLGAATGKLFPPPGVASTLLGVTHGRAWDFIIGFEQTGVAMSAEYRLGQAYRRWALERAL